MLVVGICWEGACTTTTLVSTNKNTSVTNARSSHARPWCRVQIATRSLVAVTYSIAAALRWLQGGTVAEAAVVRTLKGHKDTPQKNTHTGQRRS